MRLFILITAACLLFSCRATKQSRTEDVITYDSSKVVTNDSVHVKKDMSTSEQKTDKLEEGQIEVELEFQPETKPSPLQMQHNGGDSTDVNPVDEISKENSENLLAWLGLALENPRIRSAKIKGKLLRTDNSKTTTQKNITDSTVTKKTDSTNVGKQNVHIKEEKQKEQFSIWKLFPWYVWLIVALILFFSCRYLYKRYWPGSYIQRLFTSKNNT
ncbi:MAG: hypothetical protein ACTHLE_04195 [Agriterribacter sp.]